MYLLTKYIKSVLWGVAVRLSYIQDAWCLKAKDSESVKPTNHPHLVRWSGLQCNVSTMTSVGYGAVRHIVKY